MFNKYQSVGDMVAEVPAIWKFFEEHRIDYCCHGDQSLERACSESGLNPDQIISELADFVARSEKQSTVDLRSFSLTQLADHIEQTHHAYLYAELPAILKLAARVAQVHGDHDTRLWGVQQVFQTLQSELLNHLMKEEQILFPMIRQLEAEAVLPAFHCGTVANPVRQMLAEHDDASGLLEQLRTLTDDFTAPEWGCESLKALYRQLNELEHDLHRHIHKENSILFPGAVALENQKAGRSLHAAVI